MPTIQKVLNYLNPLATEAQYGLKSVENQPYSAKTEFMIRKALGLGASWGSLALLAKGLADLAHTATDDHDDKIKDYVRARYSVMSPDPDLADNSQEVALDAVGEGTPVPGELRKTAAVETPAMPLSRTPAEYMVSQHEHWMDPAVAATAMLLGVTGGAYTYDKIRTALKKKQLDKEIQDKKNQFDALVYSEYARTRGIKPPEEIAATPLSDKQASEDGMLVAPLKGLAKGVGEWANQTGSDVVGSVTHLFDTKPGDGKTPTDASRGIKEKSTEALTKSYMIAGPALFLASLLITKNYMDKRDPNRQRRDQLEKFMAERARMSPNPVMLVDDGTFKIPGMTPQDRKKALRAIAAAKQPDAQKLINLNTQLNRESAL